MTARRALFGLFSSTLVVGLAWGCSAADGLDGSSGNGAGFNGIGQDAGDERTVSPEASAEPDSGGARSPLCGAGCLPDAPPNVCARFVPPAKAVGEGGSGGQLAMSEGGAAGELRAEAGAGGEDSSSAGASGSRGEAGSGGTAGAAGAAGAAGESGAASVPPEPAPKYGCQVQRTEPEAKTVVAACAVVGSGTANAPCLTASDCAPGYGCVGDQNAGLCQQYCCQGGDNCGTGTYCAERPLRDATVNALASGVVDPNPLLIPVCVPAEKCDLSASYPCKDGTQCTCKAGTACLVVRADGTTTCAVPGRGKAGDACPCAWGHVCSAATNQCLKLCYTRGAPSCGDGKCQSASELPDGWGVCVGGSAAAE